MIRELHKQGTNKEVKEARTATTYRTTQSAAGKLASVSAMQNGQDMAMAVTYHRFYDEALDGLLSISEPAVKLYMFLLRMSDFQAGETPPIYIGQIAEKMNRSRRAVQLWLAELIKRGLVERVFRKNKYNSSWNDSSYFIITHVRDANRHDENKNNGEVK